jgi:hypothetical protein
MGREGGREGEREGCGALTKTNTSQKLKSHNHPKMDIRKRIKK